ncbi:hypothetical protein ACTA71_004145 [Dictyostelium dimigraforme]
MEEENQLMESNNENQENCSNSSNNSIDTVVNNSKDEEQYIKGLLEDDKESLTIVKRAQLLEIRNIQLEKECRSKGKWKFKELDKANVVEFELRKQITRLEVNGDCITHLNEIKSLSDTIKEMKTEIGQLRTEVERVVVENDQLKAEKQSKKEITFLDEEHSIGGEDKGKLASKNEIRDNGSEYGAIQSKGKTGKNITNEEASKVKEVLKNHGPVKFFEELENVFQMHEVITLDNRIRVIKMKILDHCNYVDRISSNMNWKQIMELVANNDDSASRQLYYKELVSNAARKVQRNGAGLLDYISVFEANYKQLHNGKTTSVIIEEFTSLMPYNIVEKVDATIDKRESISLENWFTKTREYATKKEIARTTIIKII